jgi:5-methylcytosine-specific restriction endonuclease McrA
MFFSKRLVLSAMLDIEAMELVERFFELGKRVVSSPNLIAVFLAGCRGCCPSGSSRRPGPCGASTQSTDRDFAHVGKIQRATPSDATVRNPLLPTWAKPRRPPMKRSGRLTSRVRVGQASRRRIRAGGPLASASLEAWREIRAQILARARWRCQACGLPTYRLEVHHIQKRAQGGSDVDRDRLVALCPPCHAQTDAPYVRGRLVITVLGQGRFTFEVVHGANKWATRS